jgi:hypothetical protein
MAKKRRGKKIRLVISTCVKVCRKVARVVRVKR